MQEEGIDLSAARPQKLTTELAGEAQLLITMGCGDECPYVPGIRRGDWPLEDPKGQPIERVRAIRDDLRARVEALITKRARDRSTSLPDAPPSRAMKTRHLLFRRIETTMHSGKRGHERGRLERSKRGRLISVLSPPQASADRR